MIDVEKLSEALRVTRMIDLSQTLTGRDAVGPHRDDRLRFLMASLRTALNAAGAYEVVDVETLGFRQRGPIDAGQDFSTDLRHELIEFGGIHVRSLEYFCSIRVIFCTRAACRPPAKGVASQTRKTSSA